MLLFSRNIDADLRFAAWHISEGEALFRDDLPLSALEESEILRHNNPLRSKEWLASRWLLHQLTGAQQRMPLAKDAYSKPFFAGQTGLYCSLSHSQGTVAALLSNAECGCDIQVLVEKMPRLAPKFMREDEREWVEQTSHETQFFLKHLFWTAKEAMYKAYGRKEVDFRKHLFLEPFLWDQNTVVQTQGWLRKDGIEINYQLYLGYHENSDPSVNPFVWTLAVEQG